MQINVVMTRAAIKKYVNAFLEENSLVVVYEDSDKKAQFSHHLSSDLFKGPDLIFYMASEFVFKEKIMNLSRPLLTSDKVDFIHGYTELYPEELKITDLIFSWSPAAIALGEKLKVFFDQNANKGMQVMDSTHISLNERLSHWYWTPDILNFEQRLFDTGGVVSLMPLKGDGKAV